ncbi:MAG: PhoH family protein [Deltaproteobacteria bacterium]|nr:PhoH family protein [Deltaproteobacteria bacterium]
MTRPVLHPGAAATAELQLDDVSVLQEVLGPSSNHLKIVERELGITVGARGNRILLQGRRAEVALAERALGELAGLVASGLRIGPADVTRAIRMLLETPDVKLREVFNDVVLVATNRRVITPKGVAQKRYIELMRQFDIVFGIGPAGTGKTYLAMAMAVAQLQSKAVKRIVLTRPAVEAGEKLGFLPGDMIEKVNPYLRPLYDALHDMMDLEKAQALIARGQIEVAPLAFMRGRTLNDSFVILDEAQNTTPEQMKMFLTRLGFDSKAVITGDITQVDLPDGRRSGLHEARALLEEIEGIGFCYFSDTDVVRHPLIQAIIRAYDAKDASRSKGTTEDGNE